MCDHKILLQTFCSILGVIICCFAEYALVTRFYQRVIYVISKYDIFNLYIASLECVNVNFAPYL